MIFTIREYTDNSVVVDYEDGSWANVPLNDITLNDSAHLAEEIKKYGPKPVVSWANNAAIPVGTVVDTQEPEYQVPVQPETELVYTYVEAREYLYPSLGDQADAEYWSRNGRPEDLIAIDEQIAWVKQTVPTDWTPRTRSEFIAWLETIA